VCIYFAGTRCRREKLATHSLACSQLCPRRPAAKPQRDVLITNQQNRTTNELQITFQRKSLLWRSLYNMYNWSQQNEHSSTRLFCSNILSQQSGARIYRNLSVSLERGENRKGFIVIFHDKRLLFSLLFTLFFLVHTKSNLNKLRSRHSLFSPMARPSSSLDASNKLYKHSTPLSTSQIILRSFLAGNFPKWIGFPATVLREHAISVQQNASPLMRLGCTTKPLRACYLHLLNWGGGCLEMIIYKMGRFALCPSLVKWKHLWCCRGQCKERRARKMQRRQLWSFYINWIHSLELFHSDWSP